MKKNKLTAMILMVMMISVLAMAFTGCEKEYPKLVDAISLENIDKVLYQEGHEMDQYYSNPNYVPHPDASIRELDEKEKQHFFEMLKGIGYKLKKQDEWYQTYGNKWSYIIQYNDGSHFEFGDKGIYKRGDNVKGPDSGQYHFSGDFRQLSDLIQSDN